MKLNEIIIIQTRATITEEIGPYKPTRRVRRKSFLPVGYSKDEDIGLGVLHASSSVSLPH